MRIRQIYRPNYKFFINLGIMTKIMFCTIADETKPKWPEIDFSKVEIETIKVTDKIYMLTGKGGNIGVSAGKDGIFLVDDQFAPLTDKIKDALNAIIREPIRFVLNSHWHADHTGGNENLGNSGVVIVAHQNVRLRLSTDQFIETLNKEFPAQPQDALPTVTFNDSMTFHFNDEEIHVIHLPPAHTDGDSVVHFKKANVIHAGDIFFNGIFPFIDGASDGSIDGMIQALDRLISMSDNLTKIIPGHGPLGNRDSLLESRAMLAIVRDRISAEIDEGKFREQVIADKPLEDLNEVWGKGFLTSDQFTGIVYNLLIGREE